MNNMNIIVIDMEYVPDQTIEAETVKRICGHDKLEMAGPDFFCDHCIASGACARLRASSS